MDKEPKPDEAVLALDTDDRDAKRQRLHARATEAFKRHAKESERRWLGVLGDGKPKR